jgi:hypothetical protein
VLCKVASEDATQAEQFANLIKTRAFFAWLGQYVICRARAPTEEKKEYNLFGKRSRSSRAGGVVSPLLFIAFAIKVYVDGNWNVAIASWTLDYVVGSMITLLVWIVAIFAIPAAIGVIWWIRHEMNKKP